MRGWLRAYRRTLIVCLVGVLSIGGSVAVAQSPIAVRIQWDPNPASDGVTSYTVVVDGGSPITVLPTACTTTVCTLGASLSIGSHTVSVSATNDWGTGPATTLVKALIVPGAPKNLTIVK